MKNTLPKLFLFGLLLLASLPTLSCSKPQNGLEVFEHDAFKKPGNRIEAIINPATPLTGVIAALEDYSTIPCRVEYVAEWSGPGIESNESSSLIGTALIVDEESFGYRHLLPVDGTNGKVIIIEDILLEGELWSVHTPPLISRTIQSQPWVSGGFPPQGGLLLAPMLGIHPFSQVVSLASLGNAEIERGDDEVVLSIGQVKHEIKDAPMLTYYQIVFSTETGHPIRAEWKSVDGILTKVEIQSFSFPIGLTNESFRLALEEAEALED